MEELKWIKRRRIGSSASSVTVTVNKSKSHKNPSAVFAFRNNCHLQFTRNGIVTFAVTKNRIYFKQDVEGVGYRLYERTRASNTYEFKVAMPLYEFIGDYDLLYDKEMKLSYIEKHNDN